MDLFNILDNVRAGKYFYYIFYSKGFFWRTMGLNGLDIKAVNATDIIPFVIDLPENATRARFIMTSDDNFVDIDKLEVLREPGETFYQFIDRVNGVHQ